MHLNTELQNCHLRTWQLQDKKNLIQYANNRKIWRNLAHMFPHPYTEADADFWIPFSSQSPNNLQLAIVFEGEAVGVVGAKLGEGVWSRTAQFGYWVGEPFWGRGITTAAGKALITAAWDTLAVDRLEATVFAWNPASMRVLEKLGFTRDGILRHGQYKDEQLVDVSVYGLLRNS